MLRVLTAILTLSTAVEAQALELTLTLGGQFYQGAPQYEILADEKVVATGTVTKEQGDIVTLEIGSPNTLAIRYINDLAAPKGPDGNRAPGADRNLIVEAVEIAGQRLHGKALAGAKGVVRALDTIIVSHQPDCCYPCASGGRIDDHEGAAHLQRNGRTSHRLRDQGRIPQ